MLGELEQGVIDIDREVHLGCAYIYNTCLSLSYM